MTTANIRAVMSDSWSDADFCARVEERAAALGMSVRELMAEAGLAADTLNHPAAQGRRIDTILKIAKAAKTTPDALLGITPEDDPEAQLRLARLALVADVAAHLYVALSRRSGAIGDQPTDIVQTIMTLVSGRP